MCLKDGFLAGLIFSINVLNCFPVTPLLPQRPSGPVLRFIGMEAVPDPIEEYREAIHLQWTMPGGENAWIRSFTIMRKFSLDSSFNIFAGSRLIPADTGDFYDRLDDRAFPQNGFDSVFYCMFAVDTFGRTGDTSEICKVIIAPQPRFVGYDTVKGCFEWESWIRGGIISRCTLWRENNLQKWSFTPPPAFPQTDQPGRFFACFPDSIQPPPSGKWYYALFIEANDSRSLKIGSINVR